MMRMSDLMSKLGATFFVEIALLLFFAVFVGVLLYAYGMLKKDALEQYASMPLDDEIKTPRDEEKSSAAAKAAS